MKTDKALKTVLDRRKGELPYGFEYRVMRKIQREAVHKNRVYEATGLAAVVVALVSISVGVHLLLKNFFHVDLLDIFSRIRMTAWHPVWKMPHAEFLSQFTLCITLLLVMVVLLSLDSLLRRKAVKGKLMHKE